MHSPAIPNNSSPREKCTGLWRPSHISTARLLNQKDGSSRRFHFSLGAVCREPVNSGTSPEGLLHIRWPYLAMNGSLDISHLPVICMEPGLSICPVSLYQDSTSKRACWLDVFLLTWHILESAGNREPQLRDCLQKTACEQRVEKFS